jgi:hypothetical protein
MVGRDMLAERHLRQHRVGLVAQLPRHGGGEEGQRIVLGHAAHFPQRLPPI